MTHTATHRYKTTESKYKGDAKEMYITYDLWQATRGDRQAHPTLDDLRKRCADGGSLRAACDGRGCHDGSLSVATDA